LLESLNKNYLKLQKYQKENLECILSGKELSVSKNKNFKKIQTVLVDNFKNLQIAPSVVEELVQSHYKENKRIVSLEGVLLRLAVDKAPTETVKLMSKINNQDRQISKLFRQISDKIYFINSFEKDRNNFHFNSTKIVEIDSILLMSKFYPMIIKYSMLKGINPDKPRYLSKITKTL